MTVSLAERGVRGVVLDIEGTTTPVAYVSDVLFPYARAHLREFLEAHLDSPELDEASRLLREGWERDVASGENPPEIRDVDRDVRLGCLVRYVEWLMDRDRKSSGLKLLQGQIWERGYGDGSLRGDVFDDVPPALDRWASAGIAVAVYSSGSVLAQRLLFSTTRYGDLTRFFTRFFDTGVGPKRLASSYRRIATGMQSDASALCFISDVAGELDAAREAGFQDLLCIRPGNHAEVAANRDVILTFDEIVA